MKKRILIAAIVLLSLGAIWMWFAPRIRVDMAARKYDPNKMDLWRIDSMHKSLMRKPLPNGMEIGLLHLTDGSNVKYWFVSRHVQPGLGTTRFDSADGRSAYLHGRFCCEVSLPELKDWNDLQDYITKWDGTLP